MNDFQTINDIVNESVRNSSYYTVAISSCVFILYTLIVQLIGYFKGKAKNKPLIEMAEAIKENTENIVNPQAIYLFSNFSFILSLLESDNVE